MFNVVLVAPEIPQNTGNVIRLCANTGSSLFLVRPLGFKTDDARLRRAGLDYHEFVDVVVLSSFEDYVKQNSDTRIFTFSKFHKLSYGNIAFRPGDTFVFGSETRGLSETIRAKVQPQNRLTIPMMPGNRSLNLSNAVAVVVYDAWRQNGFGHDGS